MTIKIPANGHLAPTSVKASLLIEFQKSEFKENPTKNTRGLVKA